jgi:mevalonate kinase
MLFGEYAVLFGHDAISCAFDARITATATATAEPLVVIDSPRVLPEPLCLPLAALAEGAPKNLDFVWACLAGRAPFPWGGGVRLHIEAGFPREWGFGSSSAVTVATLAALGALGGEPPEPLALAAAATALIQRVQGGVGSGYDAANQAFGGLIRYRMPRAPGQMPEVERLPMPPAEGPSLFAAWTRDKVSTPSMVRAVRERHPSGDPLYGELGALSGRAASAARAGQWDAIGGLMDEGQRLHERLGTSPEGLSRALALARRTEGVLGAKLTGAGGGDSALILARDEEAAARACERAGLTLLPSRPDPEGLRISPSPDEPPSAAYTP